MGTALTFSLYAAAITLAGAGAALLRQPGPAVAAAIQHFAAGVVFAAAASEILPGLKHEGAAWPVVIGGTAGVLLMLGVKQLGERWKGPWGLMTTVAVDILVDGLLLGLGFASGERAGVLLAIALCTELLFIGLSVTAELKEALGSRGRAFLAVAVLVLLLPIGALLGAPAAALSRPVLTALLAFGVVALLYLVTEELLVEAHVGPEAPWVTAMFFAGFLLLLLLEEGIG